MNSETNYLEYVDHMMYGPVNLCTIIPSLYPVGSVNVNKRIRMREMHVDGAYIGLTNVCVFVCDCDKQWYHIPNTSSLGARQHSPSPQGDSFLRKDTNPRRVQTKKNKKKISQFQIL